MYIFLRRQWLSNYNKLNLIGITFASIYSGFREIVPSGVIATLQAPSATSVKYSFQPISHTTWVVTNKNRLAGKHLQAETNIERH